MTFCQTGIGLRGPHVEAILGEQPKVGWLEVHSENVFHGGLMTKALETLRIQYPLSFHGVGLSLGGHGSLSKSHLKNLKRIVDRFDPIRVSEHVTWSGYTGHESTFVPDLLPLPFTKEAFQTVTTHIQQVQDYIGRTLCVENPSSYLNYVEADYAEPDFLNEICKATGCQLLLDVNNVYVSATNIGFDAQEYIRQIDLSTVGQIHLAGYMPQDINGDTVLIDTHSKPVYDPVWELYEYTLQQGGDQETLIEWDQDLPPLAELVEEAQKADVIRRKVEREYAQAS